MGRTLHYKILSSRAIEWRLQREILLAQDMLNHRYTWTCEQISLQFHREPVWPHADSVLVAKRRSGEPYVADGFTKVAEDEWNACLVVAFARWLSRRLPDASISLHDEGDYVLAGYLRFRKGAASADHVRIAEWKAYLAERGLGRYLPRLERMERLAVRGVLFAPLPAKLYANRPEIRTLGLTEAELAKATIADVAERLTMPWDTDWLLAA